MTTTRRLFLVMVACLPLAWQTKLGAVPEHQWVFDGEAFQDAWLAVLPADNVFDSTALLRALVDAEGPQ